MFELVESEGWESLDLTSIALDEYLARFQTLAGAQYKAESITAYKRRIRNALDAHEHYLTTGRPPTFRQGGKRTKTEDKQPAGSVVRMEPKAQASPEATSVRSSSGLIDFPFPLKNGGMAILRLPARITSEDANRLSAFLRTLQDDQSEQRQIPESTGKEAA